ALAVGRFHRAPDALAIDRDLLARERLAQRVRPRRQRATERGGLHGRHHAPQRVCARDPTREHEHLSELRLTLLAKVSDVVPSLATRDRAEQHQNEHIRQPMAPRTLHPRVRYLVEQRAEIRPSHALLSARCGRDGKPFETFPRASIPQSENKPTQPVLSEDAPALMSARVLSQRNRDREMVEGLGPLKEIYRDHAVYAGALLKTFLESYVVSDKLTARCVLDGEVVELDGLTDLV